MMKSIARLFFRRKSLRDIAREKAAAWKQRGQPALNAGAAEDHKRRGDIHLARSEFDQAIACYRQAMALAPEGGEPAGAAEARKNLGNGCLGKGDLAAAAAYYCQAIAIDPTYVDAVNNLGVVLLRQGENDRAMTFFRRALALKPDLAKAHLNCGNVLMAKGLTDEAAASFSDALAIDPNLAEAHNNLGNLHQLRHEIDDALACFETALRLRPDFAEAHHNLGDLLMDKGRLGEAIESFGEAIRLKADFAEAHFSLAMALLSCGRLAEGWTEYGYRFLIKDDNPIQRSFTAREWLAEPLDGKAILIWGEQGVGDEILFAGMFADICARSRRCVIECTHKLVPLFARSFPNALVVPRTEPPQPATRDGIDFQVAAAGAARWLRPCLDSFPLHKGYLSADAARVAHWKSRLAELGPGPKVGICWRSSLAHGRRNLHYTSLGQWGPIFGVPDVHFINLQYDDCADELAAARQTHGVTVHAFADLDLHNDLDEAAALTKSLDLVIGAPTAAANLAAALDVPTWMMYYGRNWTTHGADYHPWYPAMSLFPRRNGQSWEEIVALVAERLKSRRKTGYFLPEPAPQNKIGRP